MTTITKFRSRIPTDMQVFEHDVRVETGTACHPAARRFVRERKRRIYLDHLPASDDSSTIRVIGKSKGWFFTRERCIGYVPADIATKLLFANVAENVNAHINRISTYGNHSIEIHLDILGHNGDFEKYRAVH